MLPCTAEVCALPIAFKETQINLWPRYSGRGARPSLPPSRSLNSAPLTHQSANQLLRKINTSSPRRTILGFVEGDRPRIESRGFAPPHKPGTVLACDLISLRTVLMCSCQRELQFQTPIIGERNHDLIFSFLPWYVYLENSEIINIGY